MMINALSTIPDRVELSNNINEDIKGNLTINHKTQFKQAASNNQLLFPVVQNVQQV